MRRVHISVISHFTVAVVHPHIRQPCIMAVSDTRNYMLAAENDKEEAAAIANSTAHSEYKTPRAPDLKLIDHRT
jgi:hypothetical protein